MGTPEFAVPSLKKIIDNNYDVCAVFTKPDKPQGRKMIITPPPVKIFAEEHGIDVYQPEKVKSEDTINLIKSVILKKKP